MKASREYWTCGWLASLSVSLIGRFCVCCRKLSIYFWIFLLAEILILSLSHPSTHTERWFSARCLRITVVLVVWEYDATSTSGFDSCCWLSVKKKLHNKLQMKKYRWSHRQKRQILRSSLESEKNEWTSLAFLTFLFPALPFRCGQWWRLALGELHNPLDIGCGLSCAMDDDGLGTANDSPPLEDGVVGGPNDKQRNISGNVAN